MQKTYRIPMEDILYAVTIILKNERDFQVSYLLGIVILTVELLDRDVGLSSILTNLSIG